MKLIYAHYRVTSFWAFSYNFMRYSMKKLKTTLSRTLEWLSAEWLCTELSQRHINEFLPLNKVQSADVWLGEDKNYKEKALNLFRMEIFCPAY